MTESINEIITKAIKAKEENHFTKEAELIKLIERAINENRNLFESANAIDAKNNNSKALDFEVISKIFSNYKEEVPIINNQHVNITKDDILYSKVYVPSGIILVTFDGDFYTMLELIILGILTHNVMIFSSKGYMYGVNKLLIGVVEAILEKNDLHPNTFQSSIAIESDDYFNNYKTINKTVIVGDNDFIDQELKDCSTKTVISGYKHYDLYIEDIIDENLLKTIMKKENVNIYVKDSIKVTGGNVITVSDIDEAITMINHTSSKYSSAIFTKNPENASKFLRGIQSKIVLVNTSPTIEQRLDINQSDLLEEKQIVMPNIYRFDEHTYSIDIKA